LVGRLLPSFVASAFEGQIVFGARTITPPPITLRRANFLIRSKLRLNIRQPAVPECSRLPRADPVQCRCERRCAAREDDEEADTGHSADRVARLGADPIGAQ
jgi:hypothetical protein